MSIAIPPLISLTLTVPPSANRIWRMHDNYMSKSPEYRRWKKTASWEVLAQRHGRTILGLFRVKITLAPSARDPDNNIKPTLDAVQAGGAVLDDRHLRHLELTVDNDRPAGTLLVEIWEVQPCAVPAPRAVVAA